MAVLTVSGTESNVVRGVVLVRASYVMQLYPISLLAQVVMMQSDRAVPAFNVSDHSWRLTV